MHRGSARGPETHRGAPNQCQQHVDSYVPINHSMRLFPLLGQKFGKFVHCHSCLKGRHSIGGEHQRAEAQPSCVAALPVPLLLGLLLTLEEEFRCEGASGSVIWTTTLANVAATAPMAVTAIAVCAPLASAATVMAAPAKKVMNGATRVTPIAMAAFSGDAASQAATPAR